MKRNGEDKSGTKHTAHTDTHTDSGATPEELYASVIAAVTTVLAAAPDNNDLTASEVAALLQATQKLGQDNDTAHFVRRLISLLMLTAGATRGCMLWVRQGQWQIAVEEVSDTGERVHLRRRFPRASRLPLSLVGLAADKHERILVYAGTDNTIYEEDRYLLTRQPQVALCLPALYRNELMAIVYLENQAEAKAFTPRRLAVVDLIVAQAAAEVRHMLLSDELSLEIDKRQQAQASVAASTSSFRELFQNAPLCIFVIDYSKMPAVILEANRRAEKVYGLSAKEFDHMPAVYLASAEAVPALDNLFAHIVPGETISIETINRRADNTHFPVRIVATPQSGPSIGHMIMTVEDISTEARRRSEAEAIDAERRRIAHEIHDGVAQDLAALRFDSALWHGLIDQDPSQMHEKVDHLQAMLNKCIFDLRRAILAIRPVDLEGLGFLEAVRRFIREFSEQRKIAVTMKIVGEDNHLPTDYELPLYRIIQEAFHNVAQHAAASQVTLLLDLADSEPKIRLQIIDNGHGFEPGRIDLHTEDNHYGLHQMRERVQELNGYFVLRSQLGEGTELLIELPAGGERM